MNWRVKNTAFKALELLPRRVGDAVYHGLQSCSGSFALERILDEHWRTYELFTDALAQTNRTFAGQEILELGSGWFPTTPYLMLYRGQARAIHTYDIAEHFSARRLRTFNDSFGQRFGHQTPVHSSRGLPLPAGISYFPSTDLTQTPPTDHSVDLVVSRYVLQNILPDTLLALHRVFRRVLRPGGAVVHLVSPSDQRAYSDPSLSLYDFLKYTETGWDQVTTRFYYHNRLRLPQYLSLFRDADFEVDYQRHKPLDPKSSERAKFDRLPIDSHYREFSFEELTAGAFVFVLS